MILKQNMKNYHDESMFLIIPAIMDAGKPILCLEAP
jgi:hypothetical protein